MVRPLVLLSLFAGCYSPDLGNPGFYCHANDNPACPDGQDCVGGRCVNHGTTPGGGDLAGGGSHDMAVGVPHDMAMQQQKFDFATGPQDFAMTGNLCVCSLGCLSICVGPDCCAEEVILGLCTADPTCTPN